ncbi:MAG: HD domain-containing protein [Desulfobulbaceae bacterium]|uniref:HD domain-containing protein n=1 Tax=Candidatus Desulfatifera sulfidica TaxID=2841691 RepID=A0A8J6N904_9BACT|nr:HD domain-containing protein [Candidatus Desulfatifera sulfidica]
MSRIHNHTTLLSQLDTLNQEEQRHLSPWAALSSLALRRRTEPRTEYRQAYALDADRILHSHAYIRYIDKTQVFSLINNDHITHRVLHVQLVSRIGRTIGRFLHLNEDLIEAIALGHDTGHPPFGHDGETILSRLCLSHGLPPFQHNVHSVKLLDQIERKGRGWNLSLQTLDGILSHDGEIHSNHISPVTVKDFAQFNDKLTAKQNDPSHQIYPATMEGCVVRMADTIAYIGRDIEDAITLGLIKRSDIPNFSQKTLGNTNGTIVYNLVTDLINNSQSSENSSSQQPLHPHIGFSEKVAEALRKLKQFNYQSIYLHPRTREHQPLITECYQQLFSYYTKQLQTGQPQLPDEINLMTNMAESSLTNQSPASMACDFIAGMTDDFFLAEAKRIGCRIPQKQ